MEEHRSSEGRSVARWYDSRMVEFDSSEPRRKRMRRWEVAGQARFVTFSCEKRLALFSNPSIADLFARALALARRQIGFDLYAWVIMPEHVHVLMRAHEGKSAGAALSFIKRSVSNRVLARWRKLDAPVLKSITLDNGLARFWQKGGGFDRNVRDDAEFSRHVHYIHQNPVERGLVERADAWRWSSVRWWMGQREGELECDPPVGSGWDRWKGFRDW